MPGILYIVATPIGNLEDMTFRAVRILKEVNRVACEDTRSTRKLLDHYGIITPATSYHDHNEASKAEELVNRLRDGESIAIVTDAGTPLVSDPGYRIVKSAREAGIPVVPIPGACAVVTALCACGLGTDAFYFGGFLPAKPQQRRSVLEDSSAIDATIVFYETPHRILEALADIEALFPARIVVLGRELTKLHEEFLTGTAAELGKELASRSQVRGEFTLIMDRYKPTEVPGDTTIAERVQRYVAAGMPRMDAMKAVARETGLSKREVYQAVEGA